MTQRPWVMCTWRDVKIVRHRDLRVRGPGLTRQRVLCHSYSIWNALVVKSAAQKVVQRAQADVSTITQGKGQPVPAAVLKHKRQQCSTYKLRHSAATTGSQQAGTKVQQASNFDQLQVAPRKANHDGRQEQQQQQQRRGANKQRPYLPWVCDHPIGIRCAQKRPSILWYVVGQIPPAPPLDEVGLGTTKSASGAHGQHDGR